MTIRRIRATSRSTRIIKARRRDLKPENGDIRLLSVDNEAVVPINKVVQLEVTSAPDGVIHSFVIQSFGIRIDAVPGRAQPDLVQGGP